MALYQIKEVHTLSEIQEIDNSNLENIEQVEQRVSEAATISGESGMVLLDEFTPLFEAWETACRNALVLDFNLFESNTNRVQKLEDVRSDFELLENLIPGIEKTADLVREISASSNEQDQGATQINQAGLQLDEVIQQNASSSEELSSISEEQKDRQLTESRTLNSPTETKALTPENGYEEY